ncbi:hypothetical protein SAMN02983003_0204 [Devosia enhydra]|uniref:Uncharacterized protein n=1 Tax=Devosia enhydra TaxID=665118 RepID=A0A1K2HSH7_9HYPH|nr:hypothetical protein [Devosia enhydra]SFZ80912.1 hypothetical protein SAMN02983003_0204 [Devosia enhydra]
MPLPTRLLSAAFALVLAGGTAMAQEAAALSDLSACRLDAERVAVSLTFEGGACQETGEMTVGQDEMGAYDISLATVSTAEVCTMQIVPITWSGAVAVPEGPESLAVAVLNPDESVQAMGETAIAGSEGCAEPKTE